MVGTVRPLASVPPSRSPRLRTRTVELTRTKLACIARPIFPDVGAKSGRFALVPFALVVVSVGEGKLYHFWFGNWVDKVVCWIGRGWPTVRSPGFHGTWGSFSGGGSLFGRNIIDSLIANLALCRHARRLGGYRHRTIHVTFSTNVLIDLFERTAR